MFVIWAQINATYPLVTMKSHPFLKSCSYHWSKQSPKRILFLCSLNCLLQIDSAFEAFWYIGSSRKSYCMQRVKLWITQDAWIIRNSSFCTFLHPSTYSSRQVLNVLSILSNLKGWENEIGSEERWKERGQIYHYQHKIFHWFHSHQFSTTFEIFYCFEIKYRNMVKI